MAEFFFSFMIILVAVIGMAAGVLLGRKPIGGSCGGLNKIGLECDAGCKTPCAHRRKAQQHAVQQAQKH